MNSKEILKGLRTELVASHTLDTRTEEAKGYNRGLSKAVSFVDSYIEGKGLFQPLVTPEHTLKKKDGSSVKYNLSDPETWRDMPREDFDALMKEGVNVGGLNFKEEDNASKKN